MEQKWNCQFNSPPKSITVGEKLTLLCHGEQSLPLKDSIRIVSLDKKPLYSLYVLKTLKKKASFLTLEVASYRTGVFNSPFFITDGEQNLMVKNLSFAVKSVLKKPKEETEPYGPFGPFNPALPLWYIFVGIVILSCLIACISVFFYRIFKRKKFILTLLKRKTYLNPSKFFILHLRQEKTNSIKRLEFLFKTFLEDFLKIPAIQKSSKQIMKNIKRHRYQMYKTQGQNLHQILKEFSNREKDITDKSTFLKLKQMCMDFIFLLEDKKNK